MNPECKYCGHTDRLFGKEINGRFWHTGCQEAFVNAVMNLIWREVGEYSYADVKGVFHEVPSSQVL